MKESVGNSNNNARSSSLSRKEKHAEHVEAISALEKSVKEDVKRGLSLLDQCVNNIAQAKWILISVEQSVDQFQDKCPVCTELNPASSSSKTKSSQNQNSINDSNVVHSKKSNSAPNTPAKDASASGTSKKTTPKTPVSDNHEEQDSSQIKSTTNNSTSASTNDKSKPSMTKPSVTLGIRRPGPKSKTRKYAVLDRIISKAKTVSVSLQYISNMLGKQSTVKYSDIKEKLLPPTSSKFVKETKQIKKSEPINSFDFNKPQPKSVVDKPKSTITTEEMDKIVKKITSSSEHSKSSKTDKKHHHHSQHSKSSNSSSHHRRHSIDNKSEKSHPSDRKSSSTKPHSKKSSSSSHKKRLISSDSSASLSGSSDDDDDAEHKRNKSGKKHKPIVTKHDSKIKSVEIVPNDSSDSDNEVLQQKINKIKVSRDTFSAIKSKSSKKSDSAAINKIASSSSKSEDHKPRSKTKEIPSSSHSEQKNTSSKLKDEGSSSISSSSKKPPKSHVSEKSNATDEVKVKVESNNPFDAIKVKLESKSTNLKRLERKGSVASSVVSTKAESHLSTHSTKSNVSTKAESHLSTHSTKSNAASDSSGGSDATLALSALREKKLCEKGKNRTHGVLVLTKPIEKDPEELMDIDSPDNNNIEMDNPSSVETINRESIEPVINDADPKMSPSGTREISDSTVVDASVPIEPSESSNSKESTANPEVTSTKVVEVKPPVQKLGPGPRGMKRLIADLVVPEAKRRNITDTTSKEYKDLIRMALLRLPKVKQAMMMKQKAASSLGVPSDGHKKETGKKTDETASPSATQEFGEPDNNSNSSIANTEEQQPGGSSTLQEPNLGIDEDSIELAQDVIGNCLQVITNTSDDSQEQPPSSTTTNNNINTMTATTPLNTASALASIPNNENTETTTNENNIVPKPTSPNPIPMLTLQDTVSPTAMKKFFRNNSSED